MRMLTSSTCEQKAQVHSTQVPMAEPAALTSDSSPNSPYMAHHGRKKAPDGVHAPPPREGIRPSEAAEKPKSRMEKSVIHTAMFSLTCTKMTHALECVPECSEPSYTPLLPPLTATPPYLH